MLKYIQKTQMLIYASKKFISVIKASVSINKFCSMVITYTYTVILLGAENMSVKYLCPISYTYSYTLS